MLLIAVTICSILPTGLEARATEVTESNPMYRLYNPNSGEHFYTANEGEKDYLSGIGWNYEGIGWNAPVSSNSPVYRLYNPYSSDHHYTMDEGERDYLSQTGWNYEGIGWYSDDAKSVPLYRQFNPNEVIGTHNYTTSLEENDWLCTIGWQAEGIGWYGVANNDTSEVVPSPEDYVQDEPLVETEKSVGEYSVTNVEVDTSMMSVNVTVSALEACRLIVRFVPEDVYFADDYYSGKEYINDGLTQVACDVTKGDEIKEVSTFIDNADELPEYFVAEAVLVDYNGNNLCNPYEEIEHTKKHEEFEAKDVNNFEGHNVVNFDQDSTTNFGVLCDDVKIVTAREVVEELNEDKSKNYTISSPSEDIEIGDKVYLKEGTGEYLFKVAEKNTLSDGKILIKTARANDAFTGFKFEDFFKYIDVDMEGYSQSNDEKYSSNKKLSGSNSEDNSVIFSEPKEDSFNEGFSFAPRFNTMFYDIDASVNGNVYADINIEWDESIFRDIKKCDINYTITQNSTISVTKKFNPGDIKDTVDEFVKEEVDEEEDFGYVPIPIIPCIIDAYVKVGFEFSCEISGELTAEGVSVISAGCHYDSSGRCDTYSSKTSKWETHTEVKIEIKAGVTLEVGLEVLCGTASTGLEAFLGLVVEATSEDTYPSSVRHLCDECLSGTVKIRAELSFKVDFLFGIVNAVDKTLLTDEIPLFDFYVSIKNPADSMFHGKRHFGLGKCPNIIGGVGVGGRVKPDEITSMYGDAGGYVSRITDVTPLSDGNYVATVETLIDKQNTVSPEEYATFRLGYEKRLGFYSERCHCIRVDDGYYFKSLENYPVYSFYISDKHKDEDGNIVIYEKGTIDDEYHPYLSDLYKYEHHNVKILIDGDATLELIGRGKVKFGDFVNSDKRGYYYSSNWEDGLMSGAWTGYAGWRDTGQLYVYTNKKGLVSRLHERKII